MTGAGTSIAAASASGSLWLAIAGSMPVNSVALAMSFSN